MNDYTLADYHERSKHHLNRTAPGPGGLDWANQPDPFRVFVGAPRTQLALAADSLPTRFGDLRRGRLTQPQPLRLESVSVLFELSLGLSAWKSFQGTSWALRCNPSSGNLHPTEGYLVTGGVPGIDSGVHHYAPREHSLERRGRWNMSSPSLPGGVFVAISSIFWREAWKYGMRAFRYCQHDCGHAIAALSYAAAALGWRATLVAAPADADIAALLGLDRDGDFGDAEREAPEALLWVGAPGEPAPALPAPPALWSGRANRLSAEHVEWDDIARVATLVRKPRCAAPVPACARAHAVGLDPVHELAAAQVIRQRRSAVDFDGETRIAAQTFFGMLGATLASDTNPPWSGWPWPVAVHPMLFVHRVDELEPGLYALVRDADAVDALRRALRADWRWEKAGPESLPLYLLLARDLRRAARLISCHQDIAADSCFSMGMLARYGDAEREPWRYRLLYWECGLIGQTLYLEAEAAGIRATGIGCFFDDQMHALLGLRDPRWQSLYHFTVGGPVEDRRLTTLPPYPAS